MYGLLYRSRAVPGLLAADLNQIIATSQGRNADLGITGLLLHGRLDAVPTAPGEFVQWIEGPEEAVEVLFERIEQDSRHREVEVLTRGPGVGMVQGALSPDGRLFPGWAMGLVRLADLPATVSGFMTFAETWDTAAVTAA